MTDQNAVLETLLRAAMFRQRCPDGLTLASYQADFLSGEAYDGVHAHVKECSHCQADLAEIAHLKKRMWEVESTEVAWNLAQGFEWRLRQAGGVLIRALAQALNGGPQMTPAVKGTVAVSDTATQRMYLSPEQTGDLDIEVWMDPPTGDSPTCTLTVRVQSVARWPEMVGIHVQAHAADWHAEAITNETGEARFTAFPPAQGNQLWLEIYEQTDPSSSDSNGG